MKDKTYKILTTILNYIMMISTFLILIYFLKVKNYTRISTDIMLYVSLLVPYLFEKTKYRLNDKYKFIYSLFIFLAQFLGSIINLYDKFGFYDLFTHFISGILTAVIANYILELNKENKISGLVKFIYIIGFSSLVAISWETIEFLIDQFANMNMQHSQDTGVIDTMQDMLIALFGTFSYIGIKKLIKKETKN